MPASSLSTEIANSHTIDTESSVCEAAFGVEELPAPSPSWSSGINLSAEACAMPDNGKLNERILAREAKQDYLARVEAPRKRVPTMLTSPEAKRLFARFFDSMQLHTNFVSNIARSRLRTEDVEQVEAMIEQSIDKGLAELNQALDGAEALCKVNHISEFAEYDQDPLDRKVGVISSLSRKYLDLIVRFDQLMPMLATLEIDGVVKKKELDVRVLSLTVFRDSPAYVFLNVSP
jgi:hypothetical protein